MMMSLLEHSQRNCFFHRQLFYLLSGWFRIGSEQNQGFRGTFFFCRHLIDTAKRMHLLDEQPEVGEPNPVIRCISEFTTGQISLTCVPFSFSTSIEMTTHQLFIGTMENRSWATANWPAPQVIVSVSVRCFSFVLLLGLWGLLLGLWGLLWGLLLGLWFSTF